MKRIIAFFFIFSSFFAFALDVPQLSGCINDYAGLLENSKKQELESFLRHINDASKVQVALLTINSLEGDAIEDYSIRVAEEWKLGDAKESSGAILIISKEDKKMRIEVGYGLEKDLTDVVCAKIINNLIAPSFKRGNYYKGISEGLYAIVSYALKDERLIKESSKKQNIIEDEESLIFKWWKLLGMLFILYIFVFKRTGNLFWPLFLFSNIFGYDRKYKSHRRRHNWKGFDSGGFSIGSFGGSSSDDRDSFSGNGGQFGGGGASGGW
ncbi:MAG: TPM domain-containing protein [Treponema sp.]